MADQKKTDKKKKKTDKKQKTNKQLIENRFGWKREIPTASIFLMSVRLLGYNLTII